MMTSAFLFVFSLGLAAEINPVPAQHTVAPHEHLWGLARRYYGDPFRWRAIASANPQIKNPDLICPGQTLALPELPAQEQAVEAAAPVETAASIEVPAEPVKAPLVTDIQPAESAEPFSAGSLSDDRENATGYGLSIEMPPGASGQEPSLTRFQAPHGWKEDGTITDFEGQEIVAASGDLLDGHLKAHAQVKEGDRFCVLRQDAPKESDLNPRGFYLQRVGLVEVKKVLGKGRVLLLVLGSSDAVEAGDFLSRQAL